jgi:hypothetical protein
LQKGIAAQAAEEIQLERRIGRQGQEAVPGLDDIFLAAAEKCICPTAGGTGSNE